MIYLRYDSSSNSPSLCRFTFFDNKNFFHLISTNPVNKSPFNNVRDVMALNKTIAEWETLNAVCVIIQYTAQVL